LIPKGSISRLSQMENEKLEIQGEVKEQSLADNQGVRHLVTPGALHQCSAKWGEFNARILDISFVRVVVEEIGHWPVILEGQVIAMFFSMRGYDFAAEVLIQGRGEGWMRFKFDKLVPSAKSQLKSFMSAKKVGESMLEDQRVPEVRHYHGLNESELWFDKQGNVLFTYLDHTDSKYQFVVQANLDTLWVKVGRLSRAQYMNLNSIDGDLGLSPLNDKENYSRMSECRDIVTNFRTTGQVEYNLKQKLLKVISDSLYSTGHRVDFHLVRPIRVSQLSTEH